MSTNEKPQTAVGYGKPPQYSQFAKGRSGNPKGRPKGSPNLSTLLAKSLNETVIVNENGHRKTITKLNAVTKQLVNKAAAGDPRATKLLMELMRQDENDAPKHQPVIFKISEVTSRL
jgi:hypothetical protein